MATQNAIDTAQITLNAPLVFSGTFPVTFNFTGATNVTFPTSGTLATTGSIPTFPLSLAQGGTNASLVANNGGIVWCNATQFQILPGTATANQVLLSGSASSPSWSTATYPSTTVINELLYSSANNVIAGLTTGNNGVLVTSAGGVPSISSTLPNAVQDNITRLGTVGVVGGALNMTGFQINNMADPTNAQDAATKIYVDTIASGFVVQPACRVATTANLTATYANGAAGVGATLTNSGTQVALAIDGVTLSVTDRVLVKDQTTTFQNGIYTVTNVGSGATNWVLTRATDYDQPGEIIPGDLVVINEGTANAVTSWIETANVTTIGVDPILFSQFSLSPGNFLRVVNNLTDVANTLTSFNNISPLTTKGDLLTHDNTNNIRLPVGGTNFQILQVDSGSASGLAWSTATYPATTIINNILFSSANNVVSQITTQAGSGLLTNGSGVPAWVAVTGSGAPVLANTPTLITPILGIATATTLVFSPSTGGIIGTTTNDSTNAGNVGEVISSNVASPGAGITTTTTTNITSIALTAGDWDVYGNAGFQPSVIANAAFSAISTTSATLPDPSLYAMMSLSTNTLGPCSLTCPPRRISLAAPATVYLVGRFNFASGTSTAFGNIYARRAR